MMQKQKDGVNNMESQDCRTNLHLSADGNKGYAEAVAKTPKTMNTSDYLWGYAQGTAFMRRRYP